MTGIERLRQMAEDFKNVKTAEHCTFIVNTWRGRYIDDAIADIADQIEREYAEDREAIAWVREHGGLDHVKAEWRSRSNLKRMYEKEKAKVERQQRHIEFVQGKCRERQGHIVDLNKMVDEMRPRLMPEGCEWPRYESGELVQIGDDVINRFGDGPIKVRSVEFRDDNTILHEGFKTDRMVIVYPGERVKRPAPKILASDGEPLEVWQTVWDTDAEADTPLTVVEVSSDLVRCEYTWKDGKTYRPCYPPDQLTHQRPDTWERVEQDAKKYPCHYFGHERKTCDGCPAHSVYGSCKPVMTSDLVRRCKALAEKENRNE